VLVFLMKPRTRESWLFFIMTGSIGVHLSYSGPSDLMNPLWLFDIRLFIDVFFPAPILHLALIFPRRYELLRRRPWLAVIPYLLSLIHFGLYKITINNYWDPAPTLDLLGNIYLVLAILVFLLSMIWNSAKDPSLIVQRQSQVILLGIALGFVVPIIDLLLRSYWGTFLFPDPTVGFVVFLILFPLSIGYTIIRYDLFAIDTFIKRTYGYLLTTGTIAGAYVFFLLVANQALGGLEISSSPALPLVFFLIVVSIFNPLRKRFERLIDRVFYRLEYDYQVTVRRISEAMRSLLKLDDIVSAMMDFALGVMFIDSARVMLMNQAGDAYKCVSMAGKRAAPRADPEIAPPVGNNPVTSVAAQRHPGTSAQGAEADKGAKGPESEQSSELRLEPQNPFIRKLAERKKEVTVYDIPADPLYEDEREACARVFESLEATLIVPLIYEDRLTGFLSLGQKKSGKFYRSEDVNLLTTLANQGAVAIENARLLVEVIEKERMEEELAIARELQMSMMPSSCPHIDRFELAAYSMPAREVGGDFYDFIDMGEERLGVVVGDVTGKSVSGALVMAASRGIFRMLSEEELSVSEIMIRANRRTKKDGKSGMFVALLFAVVDARERMLILSSAGQTQPIFLSGERGVASLVETRGDNFPLGILEDVDYQETRLQLTPGDRVVFYTDGIVEAMNPQQEIYGFERLLATVQEAGCMSADALLKKVVDDIHMFANGAAQHDDVTVIVLSVAE
jgi:serine phosphatase RsbU (regulator of sigma subunit)